MKNLKLFGTIVVVMFVVALGTSSLLAADGAALYKAKCGACHGADGSKTEFAKTPMKALSSADVQKQSDQQLIDVTSKGKGKMPAYSAKLSADEIKAIVAHIRTLKK
jgi:mono/diheme cytochrome c family protein